MLQLVFAVVSPGAVVPNLVAGAIAEAGAQQAGDLMQASVERLCLIIACTSMLLLPRGVVVRKCQAMLDLADKFAAVLVMSMQAVLLAGKSAQLLGASA